MVRRFYAAMLLAQLLLDLGNKLTGRSGLLKMTAANKRYFFCMISTILLLMLCGCGKQAESDERSFFALDTYITMQRNIHLQNNTVTIPEGMQIDLGSTAKGHIGDEAADLLREYGVASALINLGGNVQAIGTKPDGSPWRIGVRNPFADSNLGVLEIADMAVVTSGGYERYFTDEAGNTYWHILDPKTGYPAESGIASVTVVAPEGKRCDALSTALFVMGPERAVEYWQSHGDFEMLLVLADGNIWLTDGLDEAFTLSEKETGREVTVIRHETK